ncbi:MAG: hypothetical protein II943_08405 [Victivallales bacterium]|nr:hypothetical protein [Victivallales bacterium]
MMRSSQIPLVLMACGLLFLAACANAPKQIALDYGPVQIGYCLQLDDACAGTYAPKSDRTASPNLRIGLPFLIQPEYGYDVNGLNLALLAGAGRGFKGVAAAPVFLAEQGRGFVIAPLASVVAKLDGLSVGIFNWVWDGQSIQLGLVNLRNGIVTWPDQSGIAQIGLVNCDSQGVASQFGVVNVCERAIPYLQAGLVNFAHADLPDEKMDEERHFALQVGLWNSNGRWSFPLVNVCW